jgi:hypothetical protein
MPVRQNNKATNVCGVPGLEKKICSFSLLATSEKGRGEHSLRNPECEESGESPKVMNRYD